MIKKQKLILACIDGSSVTEAVCDYSSWIANGVSAPLKLLHTIEQGNTPVIADYSGAIGLGSSEELLNELTEIEQKRRGLLIKQGQLMLDAAKHRINESGINSPLVIQMHGSLSESLIELEEEIRVVVVGIRGESHDKIDDDVGTQLEAVIRSLHKPILVVNREFTEPKTVMLAYDGSESCKKALNMVASSPLFKGTLCHIVHVGDNGEGLLREASEVLTEVGITVKTAQLSGKVEEVLAQYQRDSQIDLMMMGAFSHNRFRDFLLGSFTTKMLEATNRPLLVLR
ncbi:MAG: nucleotide-binding universal stress UspA family protein [Enterobacterales bacterium]|jgi:nucleotide-binding universal stress UspA family protein